MATEMKVEIENADALTQGELTALTMAQLSPSFSDLDSAEAALRQVSFGFVYRGGNHVALIKGDKRVLLVRFDRVDEKPKRIGTATPNFGLIKETVARVRAQAERDAREHGRNIKRIVYGGREIPAPCKFVRSRGASLVTLNAQGRCKPVGDEPQQWDGTKRHLLEVVAAVNAEAVCDEMVLFGGFDISETIDFKDYEPEVTSWSVVVWTRAEGWMAEGEAR